MKLNEFNSKVNLPKLCTSQGYTEYQFVKLPTFGWFAYNKDKTFIGNVFEVVPPDEQGKLYSYILKNKPGFLDFNVSYSEVADQRLRSNLKLHQAWTACYAMSRMEADRYQVKAAGGVKIPLKKIYEDQGLPYLVGSGIGVVTPVVRERFSFLPWPKNAVGKLLVPTFCTPRHIASLELYDWQTLERVATLYVNDEKGWYGTLGTKIVKDLKEIGTSKGNTWDYKCDFWNDKIIDISDLLTVNDYIRIWVEGRNTLFTQNPIEFIKASGRVEELANHIGTLSYNQIVELEAATGQQLAGHWKRAREHVVHLGGHTFVKRDNCYYIQKRAGLLQVSNFTLDIDAIVKTGKNFVRKGHIYYKDKIVPFEIDNKYFDSHHKFKQEINRKFLEYGLGLPIISPQFEYVILQIINSFNEDTKITTLA